MSSSMETERLRGNERLAAAYFKLLSTLDWNDQVMISGLREGLNKFLSNAHLASFSGRNKYHKTHYVTPAALSQMQNGTTKGLIWEHLVPKSTYVQGPCEQRAQDGTLTLDFIREQLDRYWYVATITVDEDRLLSRRRMPDGWDGVDVRARYASAGVELQPNPYFVQLASEP